MRTVYRPSRLVVVFAAALAVPFGAVRYGDSSRGMNPLTRWACTTERREHLDGIAGLDFMLELESCDLVSSESVVSIYASAATGWSRFLKPRRLVFRFEPMDAERSWPFIQPYDANGALITVPTVKRVLVQSRTMDDVVLRYEIGRTELAPPPEPMPAP